MSAVGCAGARAVDAAAVLTVSDWEYVVAARAGLRGGSVCGELVGAHQAAVLKKAGPADGDNATDVEAFAGRTIPCGCGAAWWSLGVWRHRLDAVPAGVALEESKGQSSWFRWLPLEDVSEPDLASRTQLEASSDALTSELFVPEGGITVGAGAAVGPRSVARLEVCGFCV